MNSLKMPARRVPVSPDQRTPVEVVDPSRAFQEIFRDRKWGGGTHSFSGTGANLEQTRVIRTELPKLCAELGVVRLLDIPCGDFYWMQHTDLTGISYIGADIVKEIVDWNEEQFGGANGRKFLNLNLCEDLLPDADLILCRDCLVHLSNDDVCKALRNNIHRSNARYLLTTTFADRDRNVDIPTGDWRTLDLTLKPFLFPPPLKVINEGCTLSGNDYADKSLALWRIQDLASVT